MGGGLMQLVAYGAQDIYLTGNPQITFFKVVYRRHTNFSMESIVQTFSGSADFGSDVVATISRNGDLVHRMYLEHDAHFKATDSSATEVGVITNYGSLLMKECEIEIGGQRIDKHYGHWHSVYSQLTEFNPSGSDFTLFNKMTGNGYGVQTDTTSDAANKPIHAKKGWTSETAVGESDIKGKFFIPLYFWFCRNPGLALPLIALQYHEVKVKITFETIENLVITDNDNDFNAGGADKGSVANKNNTGNDFKLWCDYIYLDTDERRRFAQVSHEYLIEQVQHDTISDTGDVTKDLNFNHPVKELIWASVPRAAGVETVATSGSAADNLARAPIGPIDGNYQLKLNGHDRFKERDYRYFTRTQVWQHHTGPGGIFGGNGTVLKKEDIIGVYSFALKPEEHQPSGTCNFSRIDNAQLVRSSSTTPLTDGLNVYAVNYNVLRIMSGMGGLAYSN